MPKVTRALDFSYHIVIFFSSGSSFRRRILQDQAVVRTDLYAT